MTSDSGNITPQELEQLARAYFDCRLDRTEETALKKILADSPHHSPLLDDCRTTMGLETTLARSQRPRRHTLRRIWLPAAASIAVLLAVIPSFHRSAPDNYVAVYIGGELVGDKDKARQMALQEMERDMSFMRQTLHEAEITKDEPERILNELIGDTGCDL